MDRRYVTIGRDGRTTMGDGPLRFDYNNSLIEKIFKEQSNTKPHFIEFITFYYSLPFNNLSIL